MLLIKNCWLRFVLTWVLWSQKRLFGQLRPQPFPMASFSSFPYRTISSQMLSEILDGWETNHESVVSKETGLSMCHNRSVRYFCVTKAERKHIEMRHSIIRFVISVSLLLFHFLSFCSSSITCLWRSFTGHHRSCSFNVGSTFGRNVSARV